MRIVIDTSTNKIEIASDSTQETHDLYSTESFEAISNIWLKVGWNQKYVYTFSWMGRPIIQLYLTEKSGATRRRGPR